VDQTSARSASTHWEALGEWTGAGADLSLVEGDIDLASGTVEGDGVNEVLMMPGFDDAYHGIALTTIHSTSSGEAWDCDTVVFEEYPDESPILWVADATPGPSEMDLTSTLVHELGHCVGLADQTAASTESSIMFSNAFPGIEYPGLDPDDIEAVLFLYGEAS
jgi:hypothetical protein